MVPLILENPHITAIGHLGVGYQEAAVPANSVKLHQRIGPVQGGASKAFAGQRTTSCSDDRLRGSGAAKSGRRTSQGSPATERHCTWPRIPRTRRL